MSLKYFLLIIITLTSKLIYAQDYPSKIKTYLNNIGQKTQIVKQECSNEKHVKILGPQIINNIITVENILKDTIKNIYLNSQAKTSKCFKDQICNINSSLFSLMEPILRLRKILPKNSCGILSKGESDCYQNLTQGMWKTIVQQIKAVSSILHFIFKSENKTSNALHLIRQLKNPVTFITGIVKDIIHIINEAIKYNFTCNKWENDYFLNRGKCLKPIHSWKYADCNQQMNAFCGTVGFILGQPLASYVMGRLVGTISGGVDSAKIMFPFLNAAKKSKLWMKTKDKLQVLTIKNKSYMPPKKLTEQNLIQKYNNVINSSFSDGFSSGKNSSLRFNYIMGSQKYKEAYFIYKMRQHKIEVVTIGKKYILKKYKNNPNVNAKHVAEQYEDYINIIHDTDKIADPKILKQLAKAYGQNNNKAPIIKTLNRQEEIKRNLFFKQRNTNMETISILRAVEKASDQISRYLATRELSIMHLNIQNKKTTTVSSLKKPSIYKKPEFFTVEHIRYSYEFARPTTPPWEQFNGIMPSKTHQIMTREMSSIYLKMNFPIVYY